MIKLKPEIYQPEALQSLKNMYLKKRIPHALLIQTPGGVGETELAEVIVNYLICEKPIEALVPCNKCNSCLLQKSGSYPDYHEIKPKGLMRSIKVDDMTAMTKALYTTSMTGSAKIAVIEQAETLRKETANQFLKILEEPPEKTFFILMTTRHERLLPTIKSRCQSIRLKLLNNPTIMQLLKDYELSKEDQEFITAISRGRYKKVEQLLDTIQEYKQLARILSKILCHRENTLTMICELSSNFTGKLRELRKEFDKNSEAQLKNKTAELKDLQPGVRNAVLSEIEEQLKSEQGEFERGQRAVFFDTLMELWRDILLLKHKNESALIHKFLKSELKEAAQKYSEEEIMTALNDIEIVRGATVYLNARTDYVIPGLLVKNTSVVNENNLLRSAIISSLK